MVYLANISSQSLLIGQHKEFSSAAAGGVKKGFIGTCSCAYLNLNLCCLKISFTSLLNSKSFQGFTRTWSISGRTGRRSLVTACFLGGSVPFVTILLTLEKNLLLLLLLLLPSGSYSPVKMLDLDCSSEPQLRICILFMGIFKILE